MDFSAFSDDNFNVKEWVNDVFSSPEAADNKENYATQLVMKLQLFIQEVNNSLEEASQQVLQNLPRVVRDTDTIRQEADLLQLQMKSVKKDVDKVEHDTAQSMQMLLSIDKLKSRMLGASSALQEADNWTTLSVDVDEVFQSGDFNAIAAKLQGMQNSLRILVDISDYKDRCSHLENLKNRLETLLSPHLIAAMNNNSVDSAQMYVRIFRDIDRLTEVQKYYHNCQKVLLLRKWMEIVEADQDSTFVNWLSLFFDMLLSHWHSQMKWCSQVFPDLSAVEILCKLMNDVLQNLDPSLSICLSSMLKKQDDPLLLLIEVKQIVERFSRSLGAAIKIHNSGSVQKESLMPLASAIFGIFTPHIRKYATYEEKRLCSKLDTIQFTSDDSTDAIRLLSDSVMKVFLFVDEANNNCLQFTNGCCYPNLFKAFVPFFRAYVEKVKSTIIVWRDSLKLTDNSASDWSYLQQVLQAIQICGKIVLQTELLDQSLVTSFLNSMNKFGFLENADGNIKDVSIFGSLENVCLEIHEQLALKNLAEKVSDESDASFLQDVKLLETKLCETVGKIAFEIFFAEIQQQLSYIPNMKTWSQENPTGVLTTDFPNFGFVPQEYITQIGQYLMTVPQHIEPFIMHDNPAIRTALKHSRLSHLKNKEVQFHDNVAEYLLECIAAKACDVYVESILRIKEVTQYAARQLATDIDYFCNVLDDLNLHTSGNLASISALLKASKEDYAKVAEGKPPPLVSAVRGLRNIDIR